MFEETMVEMKWTDVRNCVDQNALVLLPLGVIEEHGPHLCLGTDAFIAHIQCRFIKEALEAKGHAVAIAPPFYWGVCQATGSFLGSFRIRRETAKALLVDILTSLAEFGFRNVCGVTGHGDIQHNVAVLEAFKEASTALGVNARYVIPQGVMQHYGLDGNEPYVCPLKPQTISVSASEYPDVHAGDIESAAMHEFYPHLIDAEKARSLPPIRLGDDRIMTWLLGGHTQDLSPQGYLGAPADYVSVDVLSHFRDIAERASQAMLGCVPKESRMASFDPFPTIQTDFLLLRRMAQTDLQDIFGMRSDLRMHEHTDTKPDHTIDETASYIERMNDGVQQGKWIIWAMEHRPSRRVVGSISIWNLNDARASGELGFGIIPEFQGRGLMRDALSRVVAHGFEAMNLRIIEAYTEADNVRARRLLESAGFTAVDTVDEPGSSVGRVYHMIVYRLEKVPSVVR